MPLITEHQAANINQTIDTLRTSRKMRTMLDSPVLSARVQLNVDIRHKDGTFTNNKEFSDRTDRGGAELAKMARAYFIRYYDRLIAACIRDLNRLGAEIPKEEN